MPKQVYKSDQFHGGLNSSSDPRDVADNELPVATDVMIDELGRVRTMGRIDTQGLAARANQISSGYGLFQFSHDRVDGHTIAAGADDAETGADYLAFSEPDTAGTVDVYSNEDTTWGSPITGMTNNSGGLRKDVFYFIDGSLRVSDSEFGNTNENMWYGYIDRKWFPDISGGYQIDQWYLATQKIDAPLASYYDNDFDFSGTGESGTSDLIGTAVSNTWTKVETRANIETQFQTSGSGSDAGGIIRCVVNYAYTVADVYAGGDAVNIVIKTGPYDSTDGWDDNAQTVTATDGFKAAGAYTDSQTFNFDVDDTDPDTVNWSSAGSSGTDQWRCEITTYGGTTYKAINTAYVYEAGSALPELDSGGTFTNGYATGNNVIMAFDWSLTTGGSGWNDAGNEGEWNVGVTFIYDGVQESQITELLDEADGSTKALDVPSDGAAVRPKIFLAIADPTHDGAGDGDGTTWNKRITGCNIYMKDVAQDTTQPWFLQFSADFITGNLKVADTQKDYPSFLYADSSNQNYYYWTIDAVNLTSPAAITTYQINSGLIDEEQSIISKFRSAVVANRTVYIGGLELQNEDGTSEVQLDAMIKSPVNKFDIFPVSRIIEASVRDGDEIIKLEEYADRILQFKKRKMHLINISQELEFLEDTFMHKGVSHPSATCKTDFGIAWVNNFGCYLYDGQKVNNLIEKGGRQIIKESDWSSFITDNSIIGYIPQKRQLLVLKDCTATSAGDTFLYDMVTQSWVEGNSRITDTQKKTNFVVDWNGDLVFAEDSGVVGVDDLTPTPTSAWEGSQSHTNVEQTSTDGVGTGLKCSILTSGGGSPGLPTFTITHSGSGYVVDEEIRFTDPGSTSNIATLIVSTLIVSVSKWIDTSSATTGLSLNTKDIDFGQPSIRKKIYKAYVSYKGDGSGVTIAYAVNGDNNTTASFYRTTADGSTDGTNSDSTPLLDVGTDDWVLAELKPTSSINNVYSFQLQFSGTAASDFEINDISIVFRLKNVR